jgi:hypothetical protein
MACIFCVESWTQDHDHPSLMARGEPAPTSGPSTGCLLLLSCG